MVAPAAYALQHSSQAGPTGESHTRSIAAAASAPQGDPILARPPAAKHRATSGDKLPPALGGIPGVAVRAYKHAAAMTDGQDPGCQVSWTLIAGIGLVESNHGRAHGAHLMASGRTSKPILGPRLDGSGGFAAVADTDNGRLDHDKTSDRAVGPMQFIPSSWERHAVDGDDDGKRDPNDINDAAATTAAYLCADGADLATSTGQQEAVYSYNHSAAYVNTVLGVARAYAAGRYDAAPRLYPYPMALPTEPAAPTASPSAAPAQTKPPKKTPVIVTVTQPPKHRSQLR